MAGFKRYEDLTNSWAMPEEGQGILPQLNSDPYKPIDAASITKVDDIGQGYDDWGKVVAPKFEEPQQTWGETALGVATAPARMATALAGSLSPYGQDGWQVPPIIDEGVNALSAVGDAYNYGMSEDEMRNRALGMASFMFAGGGPALALEKNLAQRGINSTADMIPTAVKDYGQAAYRSLRYPNEQSAYAEIPFHMQPIVGGMADPSNIFTSKVGAVRNTRNAYQHVADNNYANDWFDENVTPSEAGYNNALIQSRKPEFDVIDGATKVADDARYNDLVRRSFERFGKHYEALSPDETRVIRDGVTNRASFDVIEGGLLDRLSSAYTPDNQLNMFGGRNAKTANLERLAIAERLAAEGADRRAIWDQTGWFQGPDSKWRFEIDDSQAGFNVGGEHPWKVGNALKHPDLAAAYPDVPGISVARSQPTGSAVYHEATDHIGLGANPHRADGSNLLHEVQHALQGREGFARGSNPDNAFKSYLDRYNDLGDMIAVYTRHEMLGEPLDAATDYVARVRGKQPGELSYMLQTHGGKDELLAKQEQIKAGNGGTVSPHEWYRRHAGEVEARNVQARMNMSADERKATPPWETQDIPDTDQIFRLYSNASKEGAIPALLDMGQEARLARAREMGFDTDNVLYHGTASPDFSEFDVNRSGAGAGSPAERAAWLSPSQEQANHYTFYGAPETEYMMGAEASDYMLPMGARVMPTVVKGRYKTLSVDDIPEIKSGWNPDELTYNSAVFERELERARSDGFDGAVFKNVRESGAPADQWAVFDPRNIRSVNAAFDPAKSDSANLLAANADSRPALLGAGQEQDIPDWLLPYLR